MQSSKAEYKRCIGTRTNHKSNQIVVQFNCESNPSEGVELQLLGEVRKLLIIVIIVPVWSEKKPLFNFVCFIIIFFATESDSRIDSMDCCLDLESQTDSIPTLMITPVE